MLSYKRVLNLMNNGMCIAEISQAVFELLRSEVMTRNPHRSRKLSFLLKLPISAENDVTVDQ